MLLFNNAIAQENTLSESSASAKKAVETGKEMPMSDNTTASFAQHVAAEMEKESISETSQQYQRKNLYESDRNASFLEKMHQAVLMQRLGVDLEKIKQLKEKIEELESLQESGDISQEDFNKQVTALEKMIAEEYKKGQERRQEMEQKKAESPTDDSNESELLI